MTIIDKIAWIHLENGAILSSRSRGKDVYYIPGGKIIFDHLHETARMR
jgi:hypothetical protein